MQHSQQTNYNNKYRNNNCSDKSNVKLKNEAINDIRLKIRDRGDGGPLKERYESRNNKPNRNNITTTTKSDELKRFGKRDVNIQEMTKSKNTLLNDEVKVKIPDTTKAVEAEAKKPETKSKMKVEKRPNITKTPSIRTVTDADTAKTYKAVTFAERKQKKALQIKLPHFSNVKKTRIPKLIHKSVTDKTSNVDDKVKKEKKLKHKREVTSPLRCQDGGSPPTEISKWTPHVTEYTKPYYEAWLDTNLAAMSNKNRKLYMERRDFINSFQNSLRLRSISPELMYENFTDERFTGKIKISH